MTRARSLEVVGVVGAVASIVAGLDYVLNAGFVQWLLTPVNVPLLLVVLVVGGIAALGVAWRRLKRLDRRQRIVLADAGSVMNYVIDNHLLRGVSHLDLYHYTAETLVTPWRALLEEHSGPLTIRLLVRRPETDAQKRRVSEGSLDTTQEIAEANRNISIDVRFYEHDPVLRLQFYRQAARTITCLAGVYRFDRSHPMKFIGAENNAMAVLRGDNSRDALVVDALHSRFSEEWDRGSPLRAVIFDMDGVLIDSMGDHLQAWKEAFKAENIRPHDEEFRRDIHRLEGRSPAETVRDLLAKYRVDVTDDLVDKIVAHKSERYLIDSMNAERMPGVEQVVSYLKSCGVPLAVVTGSSRDAAMATVNRLFPDTFAVIISGNDVPNGKPAPDPYLAAVEGLRVTNLHQCLVIENAPLGVRAAAAAGIPVFAIHTNSPLAPADLTAAGAHSVFSSHAELLEVIRDLRFGDLRTPHRRTTGTRHSAP